MSDPSKLDPSDWFAAIVAGSLAGIGSAFAWFVKTKDRLYTKISQQQEHINSVDKRLNEQTTKIAVLENSFKGMEKSLEDIKIATSNTNIMLSNFLYGKHNGGDK